MTALVVWLAVACAAVAVSQAAPAHPEIDFKGRLYRSVFASGPGGLSSGDIADVPEPLRTRLSGYLIRRASFMSAFESTSTTFEEAARDAKKRDLERAIVALIDRPDASRLAIAFLKDAPIAYEWEGEHAGPLAEASYAEQFLARDPASPLAPFLLVFIAQRQRVLFETYDREENPDGEKAAAKKYLDFLARARSVPDKVYGLIADDLDRRPYVYIDIGKHPRDVAVAR